MFKDIKKKWDLFRRFPLTGSGVMANFRKCKKCGKVEGDMLSSFRSAYGFYFKSTCRCGSKEFDTIGWSEVRSNHYNVWRETCGVPCAVQRVQLR